MSEELHYENGTVTLPAIMDLTRAAELKDCFGAAQADGKAVTVDAGGVQRITTPCIQVMVAAIKDIKSAGGSIVYVNVPEVLRNTSDILGLSGILGLPEA